MSQKLWIEWIGLWGSGKTTSIKCASSYLEKSGNSINKTKKYLLRNRSSKFFGLLKISPHTLIISIRLFSLLFPTYINARYKKNTILIDELRSFSSCYIARVFAVSDCCGDITLWEGEFHLLPILGLKKIRIEKIIDLLLSVNSNRANRFIVLDIDIDVAKSRIIKDQEDGTNLRFPDAQIKQGLEYFSAFHEAQDYMVKSLRERGAIVYESNGDIIDIQNFIRLNP